MKVLQRTLTALFVPLIAAGAVAFAWAGPGNDAHGPSQAAADILREAAGADMAFIAAGMVQESASPSDLATLLQFPTDELAVVSLSGAQVRQALERSASLYPANNTAFLQLSGLTVTVSRSAPPDSRVVNVLVGGDKLDDGRSYTVAMPASLARGGLGYFKVWERSQIQRTLEGKTLESYLSGRSATAASNAPRWTFAN